MSMERPSSRQDRDAPKSPETVGEVADHLAISILADSIRRVSGEFPEDTMIMGMKDRIIAQSDILFERTHSSFEKLLKGMT
jgi:hypothetical protein